MVYKNIRERIGIDQYSGELVRYVKMGTTAVGWGILPVSLRKMTELSLNQKMAERGGFEPPVTG